MNLKLQQVAAQTRRMSRKKDCADNDENPSGNDVAAFTCVQMPGQDKAELRTACSVVESSKDALTSCKACASHTMAVNAESEIVPVRCSEDADALVAKTDISRPKCTSYSEMLVFKLSQQSPMSSAPLSLSTENMTASESDRYMLLSKDSEAEAGKDEDSVLTVTDINEASVGVIEGLQMVVLGMDCTSKETVVEHITEYRSPLEHFHSKRQGIELEVGTM